MNPDDMKALSDRIHEDLRLRTLPVAVSFHDQEPQWPEKTRRPSQTLKKKITLCQAMTLARTYRWTVGLTAEDIVCVPALIAFGHTDKDPQHLLCSFFARVGWSKDEETAAGEVAGMALMPKDQATAMLLSPLSKGLVDPDTVVFYGNPAQIMRLVHAWTYMTGQQVQSGFSGKIECREYLATPYLSGQANVVIPGNGDRIMSGTQDDEMIFALPGDKLQLLGIGLDKAGRTLGAKYPVPFYQNFQPEFPGVFKELADEAGLNIG